ncbi:hypothetical protein MNBD_GAMMA09-1617 [hydrothermal vent metagenome]|uniref:DUF4136 domain-containing protein n=1 Tax=hydrothermal vent metagenome TaxID=652676 RepID=A0A3B0Y1I5_9ZZZZ
MRAVRIILILSSLLWLVSCSSLTVGYDYNQKIDFSTFNTYDWIPFPEDMPASTMDRARFLTSVEISLASKGISHSASNPDFLIATHFIRKNTVDINNWGYSYAANTYYSGSNSSKFGRYGFGSDYSSSGGISAYQYEKGTLIIDFVNAKTKKLAWRAVAKAIINPASTPEKQSERVNDAVNEILSQFPPKKTM